MDLLLYLFIVVFAAVADLITLIWHRARESGNRKRAILLSVVLESLSWVPIWLAISEQDLIIVACSVFGSAVGTYLGMLGLK